MKKFLSLLLSALLLLPASAQAADSAPSSLVEDYAGRGSVIALISAGFYTEHPALAEAPDSPLLYEEQVDEVLSGAWLSEKIPAAWDFADDDSDVSHTSFIGTSAATLAGGMFTGAGDTVHEDGTVIHEASYKGAAPHAQLLLFKAAPDTSVRLRPDAAAQALEAALALHADAIWLDTDGLTLTAALRAALLKAEKAGVPILAGTGDNSAARDIGPIPAAYTDHGTLSAFASWPGITLVGAAADPYAEISSFLLTEEGKEDVPVSYTDSCPDYFDAPFAALLSGRSLPLVPVPGFGRPADYADLDVQDKIVLIARGEIPFTEKAQAAADAGAAAFIVADNGSGISRMALEEAPIPGVMIDQSAGETLRSAKKASITFPEPILTAASFSASGISDDLSAAPAFLCYGQRVTAGIPPSQLTSNAYYANVTGTNLAAASAAGYTARAAEYLRAVGADASLALSAAASAARPLTDTDGHPLSLREAGCGLVSDRGTYAPVIAAAGGSPISLCGSLEYNSASLSLTLTNTTAVRQSVSFTVSASYEAVETDKNGTAVLTGAHLPLEGMRAYAFDSVANLCGDKTLVYNLKPGASVTVPVQLVLYDSIAAPLHEIFPHGFFIDGAVTVQCGESVIHHPYTAFCGDWASAPLADVSLYDGETPLIRANSLSAHLFGGGTDGFSMPLGTRNPYASDSPLGDCGNLVNPSLLGRGWIELELCALRNIDTMRVDFYDSENRKILTRELGSAEKYIRNGTAKIALWDFAAVDNPDYLFPDGEYRCEIRLASLFGKKKAEQTLRFSFILDSEKPTLTDISARKEGDQTLLTVKAADNRALLDVSVYDSVFTYSAKEGAGTAFAGQKEAEMTFDITQFDGLSPLYLEITDRTGTYITLRLSPEELTALLSREP